MDDRPKKRFTKVQCHACQVFGHSVTHCTLLPRVLAILRFQEKNSQQCDTVLQKHITQNSISSKKTFVRALQQAHVLPDDNDSDQYMDEDIIIQAIIDNDIDVENIQISE